MAVWLACDRWLWLGRERGCRPAPAAHLGETRDGRELPGDSAVCVARAARGEEKLRVGQINGVDGVALLGHRRRHITEATCVLSDLAHHLEGALCQLADLREEVVLGGTPGASAVLGPLVLDKPLLVVWIDRRGAVAGREARLGRRHALRPQALRVAVRRNLRPQAVDGHVVVVVVARAEAGLEGEHAAHRRAAAVHAAVCVAQRTAGLDVEAGGKPADDGDGADGGEQRGPACRRCAVLVQTVRRLRAGLRHSVRRSFQAAQRSTR
mmetsp:Transcript_50454/g.118436  ORF Transcript_50454/g.118436 Transcript_50454/m.118436 type:complete len:267 (+) Transcript_50454:315-1115(+)